MGKFKARQDIKVKCPTITDTVKVYTWLENNYELNSGEWDIFEKNPDVIEGSERVSGYYEPEVRYTSNGDGNPEYIELEEGTDEEWLEYEIEKGTGIKVKVDCSLEPIEEEWD